MECGALSKVDTSRLLASSENHGRHSQKKGKAQTSAEMDKFIKDQTLAAYPDGAQALDNLNKAMESIKLRLGVMYSFWKETVKECESYRSKVVDGKADTINDADQVMALWAGYQDALKKAVASIRETSVAIGIHAIASPNIEERKTITEGGRKPESGKGFFGLIKKLIWG